MHRTDSSRSVPLATVTSAVLVPGVPILPTGGTPTGEASWPGELDPADSARREDLRIRK
jgi:hypothetical protein